MLHAPLRRRAHLAPRAARPPRDRRLGARRASREPGRAERPVRALDDRPGQDRARTPRPARPAGRPAGSSSSSPTAPTSVRPARIDDWAERGRAVVAALRATAEASQADVVAELEATGATYESFWVDNTVHVESAAPAPRDCSSRSTPTSRHIRAPDAVPLEPTTPGQRHALSAGVEWGVADIHADQVWQQFGVRGDGPRRRQHRLGRPVRPPGARALLPRRERRRHVHPRPQLVGPDRALRTRAGPVRQRRPRHPHDGHDGRRRRGGQPHRSRSGRASGSPRRAARPTRAASSPSPPRPSGCWPRPTSPATTPTRRSGRTSSTTPGAAQHRRRLVPRLHRRLGRPRASSRSSPTATPAPRARPAAPRASTPRRTRWATTPRTARIADRSSRGPGTGDVTKPDVAAPGTAVRSSVPGGGYAVLQRHVDGGAPHVSGTIALLWSAAPSLVGDIDGTRQLLDDTAHDQADGQCGGDADDNNVYGEGRLDALAVVEAAPRGPTGQLSGQRGRRGVRGSRRGCAGHPDRSVVADRDDRSRRPLRPHADAGRLRARGHAVRLRRRRAGRPHPRGRLGRSGCAAHALATGGAARPRRRCVGPGLAALRPRRAPWDAAGDLHRPRDRRLPVGGPRRAHLLGRGQRRLSGLPAPDRRRPG